MSTTFRPSPGQVALLEHSDADRVETGLVAISDDDRVVVDLGPNTPDQPEHEDVLVSVCAPDALYRLKATADPGRDRGIVVLSGLEEVDRIQRRATARIPLRLGVALASLDEPTTEIHSVTGFTIDIGVGGVQVETMRALPPGDPTVMLTLPEGTPIVALAQVLETREDHGAYRTRLAFKDLPPDAMTALKALIDAASRV
jgi:hypothetical protein